MSAEPSVGETTRELAVRTLAGGEAGQGPGFGEIKGLAVGPTGTLYVTEPSRVSLVTTDGNVTTLAVDESTLGFRYITVGRDGTAYVVDGRDAIRKITAGGTISDVVGGIDRPGQDDGSGSGDASPATPFSLILGISVDTAGTLYVADHGSVRAVTPDGQVSTLGTCAQPAGPGACGELAVDTGGTIHFRTDDGHLVRRMTPDGQVSTLAGSDRGPEVGPSDLVDGVGDKARFGRMFGFALDPRDSTVYVTDWRGLRKVRPDGTVTTVGGADGLVDDQGNRLPGPIDAPEHRFLGPIAIGADGTIFAAVRGAILTIHGA